MLAAHGAGVDWVVPQALALTQSWRSRVLVEVTGTAGFLVRPLEQAGVKVETVQRRFHVEACASLDAAVTARQSGTATSQS